MKKRILFIVLATVVAIGAFGFLSEERVVNSEESTEEGEGREAKNEAPNGSVEIAPTVNQAPIAAKTTTSSATVVANGSLVLRAQNMGEVTSLMGGVVKRITVKEGQAVSKGQMVAMVENTDVVSLQRDYFSASKEARMARLELERQQTLAQNGAGVKKNLQQAQKEVQVADAALVGIGRQLQQMGISTASVSKGNFTTVFPLHAPISGTVAQITASLGSYVDMQTPVLSIRNNKAIECDLNVFEKDINRVKIGNPVTLSITNQPGVTVTGHVSGMNDYFNDGTKSVAVHVKLDDIRGRKLFHGMFVTGRIDVNNAQK